MGVNEKSQKPGKSIGSTEYLIAPFYRIYYRIEYNFKFMALIGRFAKSLHCFLEGLWDFLFELIVSVEWKVNFK